MNPQQQPTPFNILLADDDPTDCFFFKEALKEFSIPTNLTVVQDGEQLMLLFTNEVNKLPKVFFLYLNMPGKSHFKCLSEIKANKKLTTLPVIVYSTPFYNKIATSLYENGASYYISKPIEISRLKKAVRQSITLIMQENFQQPNKDWFLLTEERKNSKPFLWSKEIKLIAQSSIGRSIFLKLIKVIEGPAWQLRGI